jgi:hypothetical protein
MVLDKEGDRSALLAALVALRGQVSITDVASNMALLDLAQRVSKAAVAEQAKEAEGAQ